MNALSEYHTFKTESSQADRNVTRYLSEIDLFFGISPFEYNICRRECLKQTELEKETHA